MDRMRTDHIYRVSMEAVYYADPYEILAESIRRALLEMRATFVDRAAPIGIVDIRPDFGTFRVEISRNERLATFEIKSEVEVTYNYDTESMARARDSGRSERR